MTNDTTDPRTALEALCDLIEQDDAEFGPEAASDGTYRIRECVSIETGYDSLSVYRDDHGRPTINAELWHGESCRRILTEADALAVLVAGGYREGGVK